ncbi:hypothetical protein B0G38_003923 [Arthrobacter sp. VKM Ac-2550]|nr:hypothetical protein [Arthrobacter sp. VKM Ac-2550]
MVGPPPLSMRVPDPLTGFGYGSGDANASASSNNYKGKPFRVIIRLSTLWTTRLSVSSWGGIERHKDVASHLRRQLEGAFDAWDTY